MSYVCPVCRSVFESRNCKNEHCSGFETTCAGAGDYAIFSGGLPNKIYDIRESDTSSGYLVFYNKYEYYPIEDIRHFIVISMHKEGIMEDIVYFRPDRPCAIFKIYECLHCQRLCESTLMPAIAIYGHGFACPECRAYYEYCEICEAWYPDSEMRVPEDGTGDAICDTCFDEASGYECHRCGLSFLTQGRSDIDNNTICPNCRREHYIICEFCSKVYETGTGFDMYADNRDGTLGGPHNLCSTCHTKYIANELVYDCDYCDRVWGRNWRTGDPLVPIRGELDAGATSRICPICRKSKLRDGSIAECDKCHGLFATVLLSATGKCDKCRGLDDV